MFLLNKKDDEPKSKDDRDREREKERERERERDRDRDRDRDRSNRTLDKDRERRRVVVREISFFFRFISSQKEVLKFYFFKKDSPLKRSRSRSPPGSLDYRRRQRTPELDPPAPGYRSGRDISPAARDNFRNNDDRYNKENRQGRVTKIK